MPRYIFRAGVEVVEIESDVLDDLRIRINNKNMKTGEKFVSISKIMGEKGSELKTKLNSVYDNYIINEFAKMGYELVKKEDG